MIPPYLLSNFDPMREVTLLDLVKGQHLRQKLVTLKERLLEKASPKVQKEAQNPENPISNSSPKRPKSSSTGAREDQDDLISGDVHHRKTTYTISIINSFMHQDKPVGYSLTIVGHQKGFMKSLDQFNYSFSKQLRLKFNSRDSIQTKVTKSLKFLKQVYGCSARQVKGLISVKSKLKIKLEEIVEVSAKIVNKRFFLPRMTCLG